jgi:hypothetical protein
VKGVSGGCGFDSVRVWSEMDGGETEPWVWIEVQFGDGICRYHVLNAREFSQSGRDKRKLL